MPDTNFDVIGDIHGHADVLRRLLHEIDDREGDGVFRRAYCPSASAAAPHVHACEFMGSRPGSSTNATTLPEPGLRHYHNNRHPKFGKLNR